MTHAHLPWRNAGLPGGVTMTESTVTFARAFVTFGIALVTALLTLGIQGFLGRRLAFYGLLFSPVLAAGCAVPVAWLIERGRDGRYHREVEDVRRQRAETNLRLLVLQAQLEPHFLFNTLASLRALLREDVDQAEHLVDALVSHLRSVLPRMRENAEASTLSDQLAICSSYLELMSIRLEGRLLYRIDAPAALGGVPVPPLMLLTLVENAIKHGIEPKRGIGHIDVRVERVTASESIVVSVTDDGIGFSNVSHNGLGLRNIREQLELRYGNHATLSLESPAAGGTVRLCGGFRGSRRPAVTP